MIVKLINWLALNRVFFVEAYAKNVYVNYFSSQGRFREKWLLSVTLTFNLPEQLFQMALLLLRENNCAKVFRNPCINVEVMTQRNSINFRPFYCLTFKCDLVHQPTWKNVSNGTSIPQGEQLCQILWKCRLKCWINDPDKSRRMHTLTHACTLHTRMYHIHWTEVVTMMSRSPQAGSSI